ncbi:Ig-like domain-containing protein [Aerococcaceae bacterium NML190073]|nr:Ig-like domain-containing protein [Aerococcaceae bacterium NML190073]
MQNLYKKINNLLIVLLLITNVLTPSISVFATDTDVETPAVEVLEPNDTQSVEKPHASNQEINPINVEEQEETAEPALELEQASNEVSNEEEKEEIYFSAVDPAQYISSVTLTKESGEVANGGEVGYYDNFKLAYMLNFPNELAIRSGDTLTLSIPNEMRLLANQTFDITKGSAVLGQANVNVDARTITVTFNDYFQNHPENKHLSLQVHVAWNTGILGNGGPVNLNFNGHNVSVTVGAKPQIDSTEIVSKWVTLDADDPNQFNWGGRVNNARRHLTNVEIEDTLAEGHELIEDSLIIQYLDKYETWAPYTGSQPTPKIEKTPRGFKLTFDQLDAIVALDYKTRATDGGAQVSFTNNLVLRAEGQVLDSRTFTVARQSGSGEGGGTNTPKPTPTPPVGIEVRKELTGRTLREGEFTFILTKHEAAGSREIGRVQNKEDGRVVFDAFPYVEAGTYNYTVTEETGSDPLVEYSDESIDISVVVVNKNGQLEATVNYPDDKTFNNRITPPNSTSAVIKANVLAQGCIVGEIEVELLNEDMTKVLEVVRATSTGQVTFAAIPYGKEGVTTYKIRQKAPDTAHVTYDKEAKTVTVTVKKHDTENKLVATVNPETVVFNNKCKEPTPGQAVVKAKVAATGCTVAPVEVELLEANGTTIVDTATSNNAGEVTFKALPQNKIGMTTYKVRQKVTADTAHITYDKEVKTVTVNVTKDDANNTYVATVNPETVVFNNKCKEPTPGQAIVKAKVAATGCTVAPVEVELLEANGTTIVDTATSNNAGEVTFKALPQNEIGMTTYKVRQKVTADTAHITYDKEVKTVTVNVTKDDANNTYVATVNPETVVFNNKCKEPTPGQAIVKAKVTADGCVVAPTQFELLNADGDVLETVTSNAAGEVNFPAVSYTEVGTTTYKVRQKATDTPKVEYDKAEKTVTVTVTKNDVNNTLVAKVNPEVLTFANRCIPTAPARVAIDGSVRYEGCEVKPAPTQFELLDSNKRVIQTVTSDANGKYRFQPIERTEVGNVTYYIRQKATSTPFVSYDNKEVEVIVTIRKDEDKNVYVPAIAYAVLPEYVNTCIKPKATKVVLEATVRHEGCEVAPKPTEFELVDEAGKVIQTVTSTPEGKVVFAEITYDKVSNPTYKIRQKATDTAFVDYDNREISVTVNVTNNDKNELVATPVFTNEPAFVNKCIKPIPAKMTLEATVRYEGCEVEPKPTEFELVDEAGQVVQTVTSTQDGRVIFAEITYDKEGKVNYKIRQKATDTAFVDYDNREIPVTVTVTNNNQNQLQVSAGFTNEPAFVNKCIKPTPTQVVFEATVKHEGCEVTPEPSTFELVDPTGKVVQTATSKDGKVTFEPIKYNEVTKEAQTYTIRQTSKDTAFITYDKKEVQVTVNVANNDKNVLGATVEFKNEPTFVNECIKPKATKVVLEATVRHEGCEVAPKPTEFELVDEAGKVIQTVTSTPEGKVVFTEITYDKVSNPTYKIRQKATDTAFVDYDNREISVTVNVTNNDKNELVAKPVFTNEPAFVNKCIKPTPGRVILEAKVTNKGCEVAPDATNFELLQDGKVIQTVPSKGGKVVFEVERNEVGKVTYQIRQVPGKQGNVVYDKKVVTVTVNTTNTDKNELTSIATYENDTTFVNECQGKVLPKTGEFNTVFILPIAVLAMAGALVTISFQKKEN